VGVHLSPEAWVELSGHISGTAAAGVVGALLQALVVAPGLLAVVASATLWRRGELRDVLWRHVIAGMAATALLCLAVEFASEELQYWHRNGVLIFAFLAAGLGLLALPVAWWRSCRRAQPRTATAWGAALRTLARRPPRATRLVVASALLLASTVPAALLKYRVYPEHLAWSASEACALAIVASPFAWLVGRSGFRRRRGTGLLALATTVALSGWLSLAGRWQLVHQGAAAMQEIAALMKTVGSDGMVERNTGGRWRYGPYAPLVQGTNRMLRTMQAALRSMDDLEPVLTSTAFQDPRATRETRGRLDAFRSRLGTIDSEIAGAYQRLRAEIQGASIPSDMRRKMLEGISQGTGNSPIRVTTGLTPLLGSIEELVAFMESREGRYRHEDGGLAFDTDADAARFNRLLDEVEAQQARATATVVQKKERLKDSTAAFGEWAQDPFKRTPPGRK
jgi:hypothetical protein